MTYKKKLRMMTVFLVFSIFMAGCGLSSENNEPPEIVPGPVEDQVEATVIEDEPIELVVSKDLSNIVNLDKFPDLGEEQRRMLAENGFFVNPSKEEQLFFIYEHNEYEEIPSFITTDSVLQVYHIFYDYTLRTLEDKHLIQINKEITNRMLEESIRLYDELRDTDLKNIQGNNIAFFGVAQRLLKQDLPQGIPSTVLSMIDAEYEKIISKAGFQESSIFPFELDYSQYQVRGHYTRSDDLGNYFLSMMWYGQAPMPLYKDKDTRYLELTKQAILMAKIADDNPDIIGSWEKIYTPTSFFVGNSDDLGIKDYIRIANMVYGQGFMAEEISDGSKLDTFYSEVEKLPEPRIKARYAGIDYPAGKQFRFMGQRYVMDAQMIQELVYPVLRPIPSGLDVMAVLGSDRAKELQLQNPINQEWSEYPKEVERLREEFSNYEEEDWKNNMYSGWMWVLKALIEAPKEEYPYFMKNDAWLDKSLNTALGSWSELKHDTVLYGKQSGAEMGGDEYVEGIGYIEPNLEVYKRLSWLTEYSRESLKTWEITVDEIDIKMERFQWLLDFLVSATEKQLAGEPLTQEEYDRIKIYGGILEDLTSSFAGDGMRWFEITSETDKNMAVIADYHTVGRDGVMHAGVGPAYEIYIAVPIKGQVYLTRGAVFSFHEFMHPTRLTDEGWQVMLKNGTNPPMPDWTKSFIVPLGSE